MSEQRPFRVVHIVGAMNRAGVETWLMNVARHTNPAEIEFTFVKHSGVASAYDDEILSLGHQLAVIPHVRNPWRYALRLRALLRDPQGRVAAVHSHVGHFTALPLVVAWTAGVSTRIAHSHSDNRSAQREAGVLRRTYALVASALIRRFASVGLASSPAACRSLFRRDPTVNGRYRVLPTGIDLSPFPAQGDEVRAEFGLRPGAVLVGHIGRFVEVKNHALLVALARRWQETDHNVHLALVGDGPLRAQVESDVQRAGLKDRVSFLGVRSDIPELLGAFDVMVLPSLYEGVPVALLEAQSSGCPSIVSANVDMAVDVVPGLISRLSIEDNIDEWAAEVVKMGRRAGTRADRLGALHAMQQSEYNIEVTLERLHVLWSTGD